MEVIRLSSIPYSETPKEQKSTPLICVSRVVEVKIQESDPDAKLHWYPCQLKLVVEGVGMWECKIYVCIPPYGVSNPLHALHAEIWRQQ
jgi:hypothetical protein